MSDAQSLTYTADLVRQYDRDRFLTALFAPKPVREDLLTLYAFNVEIARIRETVTEPMIGQMRLQWWRDQLTEIMDGKGPSKGHPVAEPLANLIAKRHLSQPHFFKILDARELDMTDESPATMKDLVAYCYGTSATLGLLGLEVLGVSDEVTREVVEDVGTAWALTGIARSVRHRAQSGRTVMLPDDALKAAGLFVQDLQTPDKADAAGGVVKAIVEEAQGYISTARAHRNGIDLRALPVLLQATLAVPYLNALERCEYRVYDPRLKILRPAVARLWVNAWRKRY